MRLSTLMIFAAVLPACTEEEAGNDKPEFVDSDGDGLSDTEEGELGLDPQNPDSDGDSLGDAEELKLGSDPTLVDTDGDGYEDGWEVTEGTDPADPTSVIYIGGWPYNPDKEQFSSRVWDDAGKRVGDPFPYVEMLDQHGDLVNIHDFAGQGKYIAVDLSAEWCGPCQAMAKWISGTGDPYNFDSEWPEVPEAVHNGDIYWLTIMGENQAGGIPSQETVTKWAEDYPDPNVPVLAVADRFAADAWVAFWPTTLLFDENLQIVTAPNVFNGYAALDAIQDIVNGEFE